MTDALTGIYNRHGFDEQVEQYMRQNPQKHCVVAMLDIDDFKLVNDMYGHAAGDGALQKLAESMKQYFSKDAILGRNGGDEFSIFMPDCTVVEVKPFLKKFTEETRKFYCKGEAHTFTISLGFAEYPVLADDRYEPFTSALNLTPSVIYIPRSFRFDASACLFDTSGDNGLHWLIAFFLLYQLYPIQFQLIFQHDIQPVIWQSVKLLVGLMPHIFLFTDK